MNWAQFQDPVSNMCLAGTMIASWSLTQEVVGPSLFTVMTNIFTLNSTNSVKHLGKRHCNIMYILENKHTLRTPNSLPIKSTVNVC